MRHVLASRASPPARHHMLKLLQARPALQAFHQPPVEAAAFQTGKALTSPRPPLHPLIVSVQVHTPPDQHDEGRCCACAAGAGWRCRCAAPDQEDSGAGCAGQRPAGRPGRRRVHDCRLRERGHGGAEAAAALGTTAAASARAPPSTQRPCSQLSSPRTRLAPTALPPHRLPLHPATHCRIPPSLRPSTPSRAPSSPLTTPPLWPLRRPPPLPASTWTPPPLLISWCVGDASLRLPAAPSALQLGGSVRAGLCLQQCAWDSAAAHSL